MDIPMHIIAHIETAFSSKFGIPRQSGLIPALRGTIVFTPEYRTPDAVRGLEGYSHLWLIWQFSQNFKNSTEGSGWSPTVRPPRLGGNKRVGVFAVSLLLISLDNFDFTTSFTAVTATINNIGPGLGKVGPCGNFSEFSDFSKLVFCFNMIAGRLEILPMLVMINPRTWSHPFKYKKHKAVNKIS